VVREADASTRSADGLRVVITVRPGRAARHRPVGV